MSLAHDLKVAGHTCMLVCFSGEISFIWPLLMAPDDSSRVSSTRIDFGDGAGFINDLDDA